MKKIGIVGRSGTGKTYISSFFAEKGAFVIDGDAVAHHLMNTPDLKGELVNAFGKVVLSGDSIDRKALAGIVFANPVKLRLLNAITHKYICAEFDRLISLSSAPLAVIDAAALIESGYKCDFLIAVLSDNKLCGERIILRDGISEESAFKRLNAQHPADFYASNADFIIENDGRDLNAVLEEIYEKII